MKHEGTMNGTNERMFRVQEFAEKTGVTVRTLHHYDRLGLLRPSARTPSGYRLYGRADLERLQQIVALKFLGFPLKTITELLDRRTLDFATALRMQREGIVEKRRTLDRALRAIEAAEQQAAAAGAPDWRSLVEIIEVMQMQDKMEWTNKYYSPGAKGRLAERRTADPDEARRGEDAWRVLIADVEQALGEGVNPATERAKQLAARWMGLIANFTGGDPAVAEGLKKLYVDQKNWPADFKKPYSDEVGAFICAAAAAAKK